MAKKEVSLEVQMKDELATVKKTINSFKIVKAEDMLEATTLLSNYNKHLKAITTEKEKVTKPINEALKAERARWKPIEDELNEAIAYIRNSMSAWQTAEKKREQEEESKIASRIGEGKGKLKIETATNKMAEIERAPEKHSTDAGLVKFRTDKKLKITNEILIPREYLVVDERKVLDALKAGVSIAGAEIEEIQTPINFR